MSNKPSKYLRNGPGNLNDERKKRSSEVAGNSQSNEQKKTQKEVETFKKKEINWEEERDFLKEYLRQEYPLNSKKVDKIISEKASRYIDIEKYQSWFLKNQSKKLMKNIKKSNKLSNAPKETKSFFDLEAKESNVSSDEGENEDDNENTEASDSEESEPEDNVENMDKEKQLNERKRKSEFCDLDDNPSTKKNNPTLKWLPNGNKVIIF